MFATRAVFQAPMFWLNADAPLKVVYMFDTLTVFHEPMGRLKAVA